MRFISIMPSIAMPLAILYITALNPIFKVVPLTPFQRFVCFLRSLTAFLIMPGRRDTEVQICLPPESLRDYPSHQPFI